MNYYSLLFILLLPLTAQGQNHFVSYEEEASQLQISNENKEVQLIFTVAQDYHIQANQVQNDNLIATDLSLSLPQGMSIREEGFSDFKTLHLDQEEKLQVFNGQFSVKISMQASSELSGTYPVKGSLLYQACDGRKCFFPRELDFELCLDIM